MGSSSHVDDHITRKYEIKRRIGKGAYGVVWKALDRATNQPVAVKKIFDAFCNQTDAQRTFREIMFLQEFKDHPNIVKLHDVHRASNDKDIYLIFEYMETDLHKVIKRKHILQDLHKRYIMYQLLRATYYIHSGNVIHRDQKPSNILLDSYCRCKVADFGLARSLCHPEGVEGIASTDPALTDYVATRWYRAPEILVASKQYTKGIDMWSLGCILAEMLLGKPLFPGSSTINQVEKIMATIDPPTPADLACVCPGYGSSLFQRAPAGPRVQLSEMLRGAPQDGIDLVSRLLVLNPFKRLTAAQAMEHPYVSRFRRQAREPVLQRSVVPLLRDDVQLSVHEYRSKLYELLQQHTPRSSSSGSNSSRSTITEQQPRPVAKPNKVTPKAVKSYASLIGGAGDGCGKHVLSRAKKVSDSGNSSNKSAPLSTPPLQKPMRLPEPRTRDARHTRHLSTEDVRARQLHARPLSQQLSYQLEQPAAQAHQVQQVQHHPLLPHRLSVSDSAVPVAVAKGRSSQLRRHQVQGQQGVQVTQGGPPTRTQLLQGPRVKAPQPRGRSVLPAQPPSLSQPQLISGAGRSQLGVQSRRQSFPLTGSHHTLGTLGSYQPVDLAPYLLLPHNPRLPQSRSISGNPRTGPTKQISRQHAYFPLHQQQCRSGAGRGRQSVGIISASALSELRPGFRVQW